jgi:hypothetical protein
MILYCQCQHNFSKINLIKAVVTKVPSAQQLFALLIFHGHTRH